MKAAAAKDGCGILPTPARRRSSKGTDKQLQSKGAATWKGEGIPVEAKGLSWPQAFCESTKGERVEFSEDGALATRASGVGYGMAFVGPLGLERGTSYFEVEVAEMEPKRLQTLAIGICTSLPAAKPLRAEKARDLGEGTFVVGYDLPKVFANGSEVSKISTKEWRPLKEVKAGDRIGLLIQRRSSELTVFVNGTKKVTASGLGGGGRWPEKVYGVIDLHGTVKAAWLRGPAAERRQLQRSDTVALPPPAPAPQPAEALGDLGAQLAATQEVGPRPVIKPSAETSLVSAKVEEPQQARKRTSKSGLEALGMPTKKRARANTFPCGCMVHLLRHTDEVVHVPREGEFVIGRNGKTCNLVLDSAQVPKMVSRKHAVLTTMDDAVVLQDCKSVNGTYVNDRAVGHETLRQGDMVVIGNPTQSPAELRFKIAMPTRT